MQQAHRQTFLKLEATADSWTRCAGEVQLCRREAQQRPLVVRHVGEGSLTIPVIEFLLPVLFHQCMASGVSFLSHEFVRCHEISIETVLKTAVGVSTVQCAALCAQNDLCKGVSVCPQAGSLKQDVCSLLGNNFFGSTTGLSNTSFSNCVVMKRVEQCENGGTFLDGRCRCPMEFTGETCQRRIRDCKEAFDNGYFLTYPGRTLLIQPVGTSTPFWINCALDWGGVAYPFKRSYVNPFNVSWATAKTWIGDNLSVKNASEDYFIGLENLYHLLRQANYYANLYIQYTYNQSRSVGRITYGNFVIGPESTNYSLTYSGAWPSSTEPAGNGFIGSQPLAFFTYDHNTDSCKKGYPGWFSANCTGYSFFADKMVWLINGSATNISYINMAVSRYSNITEI